MNCWHCTRLCIFFTFISFLVINHILTIKMVGQLFGDQCKLYVYEHRYLSASMLVQLTFVRTLFRLKLHT